MSLKQLKMTPKKDLFARVTFAGALMGLCQDTKAIAMDGLISEKIHTELAQLSAMSGLTNSALVEGILANNKGEDGLIRIPIKK